LITAKTKLVALECVKCSGAPETYFYFCHFVLLRKSKNKK